MVVALVVWTGVAIWLYDSHTRRTTPLLVADLAIALAAMAVTPLLKGPDYNATIPGFWVMGALLAWAIHWHWKGGLVAGAALALMDFLPRESIDQGNYGNIFLVLIGGPIVGYMCESLQRMAQERDAAQRAAAAAEERTRLARAVHDGVLQVLTMTQRQGTAAGGEWAELGRLAGAQERSLRSLIRQQDTVTPTASGLVDLTGALEAMATAHPVRVEVATPGSAVLLEAGVVEETVAAVRACLDNVLAHAGPDASAWVLAQAAPDEVTISVRDDGPGIEPGRIEACGLGGSSRCRLLDPGTHRGPRRLGAASTAATGAPSGSSRCRDDHPHHPPLPRARGRPRSRTTSPRAPRRVGVPLDRRHAHRPGGPHRLVVAGRRRRAGARAGAAGP